MRPTAFKRVLKNRAFKRKTVPRLSKSRNRFQNEFGSCNLTITRHGLGAFEYQPCQIASVQPKSRNRIRRTNQSEGNPRLRILRKAHFPRNRCSHFGIHRSSHLSNRSCRRLVERTSGCNSWSHSCWPPCDNLRSHSCRIPMNKDRVEYELGPRDVRGLGADSSREPTHHSQHPGSYNLQSIQPSKDFEPWLSPPVSNLVPSRQQRVMDGLCDMCLACERRYIQVVCQFEKEIEILSTRDQLEPKSKDIANRFTSKPSMSATN